MTETIAGSLLFLRLESTAGRKRRGPAKPAPQSIPSPLVRRLVAWVAPSAVLRASAEIVGRRASPLDTLLRKRGQNTAPEKDREAAALRGPHGVSATRGLARRHREALPRAGLAQHRGHATTLMDTATPLFRRWATASAPRVLVVDDAATVRDAARPLLKRRGYAVVAGPARRAASGRTDTPPRAASASHFPPDRADAPPAEPREPAGVRRRVMPAAAAAPADYFALASSRSLALSTPARGLWARS